MDDNKRLKDEINFKEIIKNPIRLFGIHYIYIFICLLIVGIIFVRNFGKIENNSIAPAIDSLSYDSDFNLMESSITEPIDINKLIKPTPELISKGKELYKANCASCHGEKGQGDGIAGSTMNPPPRNFLQKDKWTNGRKFSEIYQTLEEGIISRGMSSYNFLSPKDRISIVHYVQSFFNDIPVISNEEIERLNTTYKLSEGQIKPAQIPIRLASQKILVENNSFNEKIRLLKEKVLTGNNKAEENLRRYTNDLNIALSFLIKVNNLQIKTDEKLKLIISGINQNGIKPGALTLDKSEWEEIFNFIKQN